MTTANTPPKPPPAKPVLPGVQPFIDPQTRSTPQRDWRAHLAARAEAATDNADPKFSVLYVAPPKFGKTHYLMSYPKPSIAYSDTNMGTVEGFSMAHCLEHVSDSEGLRVFFEEWLPAVFHRQLPADLVETVAIDSFSNLFPLLQAAIPMPQTNAGKDEERRWYRLIRNTCNTVIRQLTSVTKPYPADPSKPCYNVVVTCHLKGDYKSVKQGSDTQLVLQEYLPKVEGGFDRELAGFFDTVMLCDKELVFNQNDDRSPAGTEEKFWCWATNPTRDYKFLGDGVGGPGKRYNKLPAKVDGTYQGLQAAWAREPEPPK